MTRVQANLLFTVVALIWCSAFVAQNQAMPSVAPMLYTGVLSVGVAFTAQVVAQRYAHAADAAIILSAETLFAAAFGYLLLGERLNTAGLIGCGLMLACILLVQLLPLAATLKHRRILTTQSN